MRTPEEKPAAETRSGSQSASNRTEDVRQSAQQQPRSGDVARPVPSTAEPGAPRGMREGWTRSYRSGFPSSPWELMRSMSEEIDRLIEGLGGARVSPSYGLTGTRGTRGLPDYRGFGSGGVWTPQIEVQQKPNSFVLRADLPGLKPDEVDVSVDDGVLTLSGERKQEHKEEREGYLRTERSYGQFYRAIPLPDGVDEEKVSASFKNGVLEVEIPITAREQRGRKIKIEA